MRGYLFRLLKENTRKLHEMHVNPSYDAENEMVDERLSECPGRATRARATIDRTLA